MSVCLIGGTGFLGRHICENFHRNKVSACVISRQPDFDFLNQYSPSIKGYKIDTEEAWSSIADSDLIIYLVSSSIPGSAWNLAHTEIENTVLSLTKFAERLYSVNRRCHLVYASSGGQIYGKYHQSLITEKSKEKPETSYALGKLLSEETLCFFSRIHNMPLTILRIANPVGRWQFGKKHGFVASAISSCLSETTLSVFGDGYNKRDYFDADEFADLIFSFCNKKPDVGIFNIGTGIGFTEFDIVSKVEHISGLSLNVKLMSERPYDLRFSVLDPTQSSSKLGWCPSKTIDEVIRKMINQYKERFS